MAQNFLVFDDSLILLGFFFLKFESNSLLSLSCVFSWWSHLFQARSRELAGLRAETKRARLHFLLHFCAPRINGIFLSRITQSSFNHIQPPCSSWSTFNYEPSRAPICISMSERRRRRGNKTTYSHAMHTAVGGECNGIVATAHDVPPGKLFLGCADWWSNGANWVATKASAQKSSHVRLLIRPVWDIRGKCRLK